MKRWALRICVFLLLGAIVNVAVAWGCFLWADDARAIGPVPGPKQWLTAPPLDWPSAPPTGIKRRTVCGMTEEYVFGEGSQFQQRFTYGLLLRSLGTAAQTSTYFSNDGEHLVNAAFAWRVPEGRRKGKYAEFARQFVPSTPIWPGFAINTLFYAGILWLMFAAPFALRRRRRIRQSRDSHHFPSDNLSMPMAA